MIVLLIAALAVAALLVAGVRIARSRARERERRDRLAVRRAAAAQRAEHERRRAVDDASDALTSVLPAIRLPWPTQQPGFDDYRDGYPYAREDDAGPAARYPGEHGGYADERGYGDRRGDYGDRRGDYREDYPAFSDLAPFQAVAEPAAPDEFGDGYGVPAGRADDYALPRGHGGEPVYPAPPGRAADYSLPAPRAGERGLPGEHGLAGEHPRRRVAQGSHRGGHGKRRRG